MLFKSIKKRMELKIIDDFIDEKLKALMKSYIEEQIDNMIKEQYQANCYKVGGENE